MKATKEIVETRVVEALSATPHKAFTVDKNLEPYALYNALVGTTFDAESYAVLAESEEGVLPLHGVPDGPCPGQQSAEPGLLSGDQGSFGRDGSGHQLHRGSGARSCPWKWWSRPSGSLLPGVSVHPGLSGVRMRYPLSLRYVPSGHQGRLSDRGTGRLA